MDILENHFAPRYCLEDYTSLFHGSGREFKIAFPMTCFCDLPLSQLHEHLDFYGGYGIGMKKEGGMLHNINPVLYMHQYSDLADCISTLAVELENGNIGDSENLRYLIKILRQIMLYEGEVLIDGRRIYKKFYDEREWRWVPFLSGNDRDNIPSLTEDEFNDPDIRSKADSELRHAARLDFEPEDVKYIIVSSEDEVSEIISRIGRISGICTEDDVRLVCAKTLCADQIKADF